MTEARQVPVYQQWLFEIGGWLDDLTTRNRQLEQQIKQLKIDYDRVGRQVADQSAQVAQLEKRFTELLSAEHERRRPQTPRSEDLGWYDVEELWRQLFHHLKELARTVPAAPTDANGRARLVHDMVMYLIAADQENLLDLLDRSRSRSGKGMVKDLTRRYAAIIAQADGIGRRYGWGSLGDLRGRPLDPAWQQPWPGCSPDDPIEFGVTPPFLVEDAVRVKAFVYTSPDLAPDPQQPALPRRN